MQEIREPSSEQNLSTQMTKQYECVADADTNPENLVLAFASMDGECVDQHFGSALGFFVYSVTPDSAALIASKSFPKEKKDGNEDKLKPKLAWLVGCDLVFCGSIGGSATKQLIALGVHPRIVKEGPDVEEVLAAFQEEWSSNASPALQRILKNKQKNTNTQFDDFDDDWEE